VLQCVLQCVAALLQYDVAMTVLKRGIIP